MGKIFAACLLLTLIAGNAAAFGPTGHRITGELAEHFLSEKSEQAIRAIIGEESLAEASTWADEMRSNPADFWQNQAGFYHYVTMPRGKRYAEVGPPPEGDALSALASFREILENPQASRAEKALALRFSVHIIGDLHQPMHVGNGRDRGGNTIRLRFFGDDTNLHRLWDSGLLNHPRRDSRQWSRELLPGLTPEQRKQWDSTAPEVWVAESARIRDTIYPHQPEIAQAYLERHLPTIKMRLQQAGFRMALYFNALFDNARFPD